jgi:TolB protein
VIARAGLIAAIVLAAAGTGRGAFPGTNGTLAYFWSGQVWVMGSDGSGARSLGAGLSPAWAPNGRRLAFDSEANGNFDVWTARADGRDRRRVTRNAALDYSASWSPDGGELVFTSDRGGNEDLYVIRVDGSGERQLTNDPGSDSGAAWSPDGARIAFARQATDHGIATTEVWAAAPDGTHPVRLFGGDGLAAMAPVWSPDGTAVLVARTNAANGQAAGIWRANADGTDVRQIVPIGDHPIWVP